MRDNCQDDGEQWQIVVDGGGSKIAVAAAPIGYSTDASPAAPLRTWHFTGTGSAHPSTWTIAQENLSSALNQVASDLHQQGRKIASVQLALAGAGRADDQTRVIQSIGARCPSLAQVPIACCGDIEPLIDYQASGAQSIAVILGTGSCVAGRNATNEMVRAGGWGPTLGDACSGGAIGLSALRYLSQLIDEGQSIDTGSDLAQEITSQLRQLHSTSDAPLNSLIIQTASDRTLAAGLATVVLARAYDHAERTAIELMEPHLADIVWQIRQVARRCTMNDQPLRLNFAGGIAEHHPSLRHAIQQACMAAGLNVIAEEVVDPLQAMLRG